MAKSPDRSTRRIDTDDIGAHAAQGGFHCSAKRTRREAKRGCSLGQTNPRGRNADRILARRYLAERTQATLVVKDAPRCAAKAPPSAPAGDPPAGPQN